MSELVYEKVAAIMAELKAIKKTNENQMQHYNFRGIDDMYNAFNPLLSKYGVLTIPNVLDDREVFGKTKNGGDMIHRFVTVEYTVVCAEDGSSFKATMKGEAMDSSDKATNKAVSAAHKYLFIQLFAIPTEDLEDADMTSPEMVERQAEYFADKEAKARQKIKDMLPEIRNLIGDDTAMSYEVDLAACKNYDEVVKLGKRARKELTEVTT